MRLLALAAALLVSAAGCADKTALVVDVHSSLAVPGEVDQLRFIVVGSTSGAMLDQTLPIDSPFPHDYTVLPGRSRANEEVRITVRAQIGTRIVAERTVMDHFQDGSTRHVRVDLDATPGDGGVDGGMGDGGPDAGCRFDSQCDDGVDCTRDSCEDGACANAPDDSLCEMGSTCDPEMGCPARPCTTVAECDDGMHCNGDEVCFEMRCGPGPTPICDDGVECTDDDCDEATDGCTSTPNDARCADGDACNGAETCSATGCLPAEMPLSCDDADACTEDTCTAAGGCTHATSDLDDDGHGDLSCMESGGVPADDCNDMDAMVAPGTPEDCNGVDDNCDGACDDAFTCCRGVTGACTTTCGTSGTRICSGTCSWGVCSPPAEVCNGIDDDCNGECDEGFGCCAGEVTSCTTSCGTTGARTCDPACGMGTCEPPVETCDGMDQDCDRRIDEGCGAPCTDDAECDDGVFCNGVETCVLRGCTPGARPTCDDGVRCTVDDCNTTSDACTHVPDARFCDDGNFCNGGETCDAVADCRVAAAPSCDDASACTDDACVGTSPGMCVGTTRDADDDGFGDRACPAAGGVTNDDCDDTRASVYPGAPEVCNGRDDDCDTMTDDGFTCARGSMGSCTTSCMTTGTRVCNSTCAWDACSPPAETCNGRDDDCNMVCDDGFACCRGMSGSCTTTCGSTGSRTCSTSCAWGTCTPPTEVCNGADDDCDAMVDDGFTCAAGTTGSCTTSCGTTGSRTCSGTCAWGSCSPPAEMCNGADDDCDTRIDESVACAAGSMGSCTTSCGSTGSRTCSAMCAWGTCTPPAETCNGADDDCDMMVDDGFTCAAGSTGSCTSSCGTTGSRTCSGTCSWGTCTPPAEACNGADDDCDTMIDDGFTCAAGSVGACTTSCGTAGMRTCSASCTWGSCVPPAETCNAADDDCDSSIDEAFTCVRGSTGGCTSSCGTPGTRTCSAACAWGACSPPSESCNGVDDDCDTMVDDGFTCAVGAVGSCTTSCGTTGSRTCSASCAWSTCSPPGETCNGVDDDCNAACDDGFACCRGMTSSCTTSCGSTGSRVCQSDCSNGTCTAPAETCTGVDDDCDAMIDEGFACVRGAVTPCTTTCGSTGNRTCSATCTAGACVPPTEICNGVDDDCDMITDEGCGACGACTGAIAVPGTGGRFPVMFQPHLQTGSCSATMGSEAYLTFTLAAPSDVFIATHGAGIDTVVYVRECNCTGMERGCNDNADGQTTSRLQLTGLAAGTYNIIVDTKAAMSGMVNVDVYIDPTDTASDRCGNVTFLAAGTTTLTGTTCGFGNEYDVANDLADCTYTQEGDVEDRVFAFYLPTARAVTFNGCTAGSNYDQTIAVRRVCNDNSAGMQVGCNDDGCGGGPGCTGALRSNLTTPVLPAGLYYFMVDAYWEAAYTCTACGGYQFNVTGL